MRKLRNKPLDRIIQLEVAFFEKEKRSTGCNQLCIREDAKYVVNPQRYLGFFVGPPNAFHVCQISADEHGGRESRKKIPINNPLHGSMRRPKVIPNGCDFHVFHDRLLVLATNMLTPSLSIRDFVCRRNDENWSGYRSADVRVGSR